MATEEYLLNRDDLIPGRFYKSAFTLTLYGKGKVDTDHAPVAYISPDDIFYLVINDANKKRFNPVLLVICGENVGEIQPPYIADFMEVVAE